MTPMPPSRQEDDMTEPQEFETSPGGDVPPTPGDAGPPAPEGQWTSGSTSGDAGTGAGSDAPGASAKSREWLSQLETMIQDIATQAAPVVREVGAKAAELAAIAAVKAGPIAQKAAEVTTDVGQRFAERAQSVAADLRAERTAATNGHSSEATPDAPPAEDVTPPPPPA
jgi:hypothetical protein